MGEAKKQHIKIENMKNRWSAVENNKYNGHTLYLMENDTYGDETEYLIIDEDNFIVLDNVYNGWLDLDEALDYFGELEEDRKHLEKYITN